MSTQSSSSSSHRVVNGDARMKHQEQRSAIPTLDRHRREESKEVEYDKQDEQKQIVAFIRLCEAEEKRVRSLFQRRQQNEHGRTGRSSI